MNGCKLSPRDMRDLLAGPIIGILASMAGVVFSDQKNTLLVTAFMLFAANLSLTGLWHLRKLTNQTAKIPFAVGLAGITVGLFVLGLVYPLWKAIGVKTDLLHVVLVAGCLIFLLGSVLFAWITYRTGLFAAPVSKIFGTLAATGTLLAPLTPLGFTFIYAALLVIGGSQALSQREARS